MSKLVVVTIEKMQSWRAEIHQFSRIGESAMIGGMTGVLSDVIPFLHGNRTI